MGVSLLPSSFTESGFMDDIDAIITEAKFQMYDFPKKDGTPGVDEPVPVAAITFQHKNKDGEEESTTQYYGCGNNKDWIPSDDGSELKPVGSKAGLNRNCGFALFQTALVEAGFPTDVISAAEGKIGFMVGANVHLNQRPIPQTKRDQEQNKAARTLLVVTKVNEVPGAKPTGKPAAGATKPAAAASNGAKPATGASPASFDELIDAALTEAIATAGGTLTKADAVKAVMAAADGNPDKSKIVSRAISPDYLNGQGRPFSFADNTLTLG